jgi:hypothetical protein
MTILKDLLMTMLGLQRDADPAKRLAVEDEDRLVDRVARSRGMTPQQVRDAIAVRRMRRMAELARRAGR